MVKISRWLEPDKQQPSEKFEPRTMSGKEIVLSDGRDVLDTAIGALDGSAGLIALWSEKQNRFVEKFSHRLGSPDIDQLHLLLQEAIPNLLAGKQTYGRLSQLTPIRTTMQSKYDPVVAASLDINHKMIGLVIVLRPATGKPFGGSDQRLLSSFARLLSASVQNLLLSEQLEEKQYKIDAMMEMSSEGIMTIDSQRRILSFNSGMERLTGWKKEEASGKYCSEVLNPVDNKGVNLCQTRCPIAGSVSGLCSFDGVITGKDGHKVDVTMN
jgi:PAS domain S-box-containing protein